MTQTSPSGIYGGRHYKMVLWHTTPDRGHCSAMSCSLLTVGRGERGDSKQNHMILSPPDQRGQQEILKQGFKSMWEFRNIIWEKGRGNILLQSWQLPAVCVEALQVKMFRKSSELWSETSLWWWRPWESQEWQTPVNWASRFSFHLSAS